MVLLCIVRGAMNSGPLASRISSKDADVSSLDSKKFIRDLPLRNHTRSLARLALFFLKKRDACLLIELLDSWRDPLLRELTRRSPYPLLGSRSTE